MEVWNEQQGESHYVQSVSSRTRRGRRVLGEIYQAGDQESDSPSRDSTPDRVLSQPGRSTVWIPQTHLEHAKLHTANNAYPLAHVTRQRARPWDRQGRPEDAKPEALCAPDAPEKPGVKNDAEATRRPPHQTETLRASRFKWRW